VRFANGRVSAQVDASDSAVDLMADGGVIAIPPLLADGGSISKRGRPETRLARRARVG